MDAIGNKVNLRLSKVAGGQKWLPALLVGLFYFNLWTPPRVWMQNLSWYVWLGYALLIYLAQGSSFTYRASRLFWSVAGLTLAGAGLSLLRAVNPDRVLWNTAGMLIYFFTLFLFLPALSSALTRRILLVSLFLAAFLWAFEIQGRLNTLGVISSHITFLGKGNDKNYISLCLALAATMLAALVVLWKPSGKLPTWFVSVLKVILVLGSGYFVYALFLTYSRSGLFTALVGYCVVIGLLLKQRYGLLRLLVAVGILALFIGFYAEDLLEQAPGWIGYFETSQFQTRLSLIQKALAIIQDNPLLGIGPDESAQRYTEYREANLIGLPHNSFLKGWAEEGIAGLMGYLIWLIAFLILLKNHFSVATLGDQIWLCLMIPYFFMMMLLDLGGNAWFMLALLCGIYGDLGHGQSDLPHIIA